MTNRPMFTRMLMMFFVFALAVGGGLVGCDSANNVDPVVEEVVEDLGSLTGHYTGTSVRLDGTTSDLYLDVVEGPATLTDVDGTVASVPTDSVVGRLTVIHPSAIVDLADFEGTISGERRELLDVTVIFDGDTSCDYLGLFLVRSDNENFGGHLNPEVVGRCDHVGTVTVTLNRTSTVPVLPNVTVVFE